MVATAANAYQVMVPEMVKSVDSYYADIDMNATNYELKKQLQDLVYPHNVLSYDNVWKAFPSVDIYLPGYPCN